MITFTLENITPEDAERILTEMDQAITEKRMINRPRLPSAVRRYTADQQSHRWYTDTAECLKFETLEKILTGDHLVDGQNRLEACRRSGISLNIWVARGVPREAFAYIDVGEKRSLRHILRIAGEPDADHLTPTLNYLCLWDERRGKFIRQLPRSTSRARSLLFADPAIRQSVIKARAVRESKLLGIGIAAALHRIFSTRDRELADGFIEAVATGANLVAGDPFLVLKTLLIANKGSRRKHHSWDLLTLCIKAWNLKREGRQIKQLKISRNEDIVLEGTITDQEESAAS